MSKAQEEALPQPRLMIIDAHNQFLRSYIVDPSMSSKGFPIGGTKGFMKILNKLTREVKPDLLVVVWDGEGGSAKRRSKHKGYKAGRKPLRLNRGDLMLSDQEQEENKIWQQLRAIEYLNQTPAIQFMERGMEADDVISYVRSLPAFREWQKVIVSSDKDFFQLLDDNTVLYRPTQGEVLNKNNIVEKYGIHPNNFALARAIAGDVSDNIDGLRGVGLSTVAKRFPFLCESEGYFVDSLINYSESQLENSSLKIYKTVIEEVLLLKRNYEIMQLSSPSMSIQTKQRIDSVIENYNPEYNKTGLLTMMLKDGVGEIRLDSLEQTFNKIKITFPLS